MVPETPKAPDRALKEVVTMMYLNNSTVNENFNTSSSLQHVGTNKPLIKISTNEAGQPTVNARDLHAFLGSRQNFADWIKGRIKDYGFAVGQDFIIILGKSTGGRPSKEYHLTIDMAKELSMVERNKRGRQARRYFIECERQAKNPIAALDDPVALRHTLLTYTEHVLALKKTVQSQSLKVAALDRIATADGSMCITSGAKHLQVRPKELFRWLVQHKWIYRRQGSKNYLAYQNRIQQGIMEHKVTTQITNEGVERVYTQARMTPKGLAKLSEAFEAILVKE